MTFPRNNSHNNAHINEKRLIISVYTGILHKDCLIFSLGVTGKRGSAGSLLYNYGLLFFDSSMSKKYQLCDFEFFTRYVFTLQSSKIGLTVTFPLHKGQRTSLKKSYNLCFSKTFGTIFCFYTPMFHSFRSLWLPQAVCIVLKSSCGKFTALRDRAKNLIVSIFLGKSEDCVRHACFDSYGWRRVSVKFRRFNMKTNSVPLKQGYFLARFKKSETAEILMLDFELHQLQTSIIHL